MTIVLRRLRGAPIVPAYRRYSAEPATDEVDWVAVDRACHGERVSMTCAERREAVHRLTAQGFSAAAIADMLRISTRSVVRHRKAPATRRQPPACGTRTAYDRHRRRGEQCSTCAEAMRPIWRELRRAGRRAGQINEKEPA